MPNKDENWVRFSWYCPNCANLVSGYKNQNGDIKLECNHCHTIMIRTFKGKKCDTINLYAPKVESY